MMGASARQTGASWLAVALAIAAGIAGQPALAAARRADRRHAGHFIVEFIRLKDWRQALTSTRGVALGCGSSFVIRFGIGMVMIRCGAWVFLFTGKSTESESSCNPTSLLRHSDFSAVAIIFRCPVDRIIFSVERYASSMIRLRSPDI